MLEEEYILGRKKNQVVEKSHPIYADEKSCVPSKQVSLTD